MSQVLMRQSFTITLLRTHPFDHVLVPIVSSSAKSRLRIDQLPIPRSIVPGPSLVCTCVRAHVTAVFSCAESLSFARGPTHERLLFTILNLPPNLRKRSLSDALAISTTYVHGQCK